VKISHKNLNLRTQNGFHNFSLGALFEIIDAYLLLVWAHFLGFWFITQVHNVGNPSELLLESEKYTQELELENKQSVSQFLAGCIV
jgi:hypothetical protein